MIKCRFWHLLKKGKCLKFKIMVFCIRTEKNPSITRFQNLFFIFPFLLPITLSNILENAYILSIFGVGNSRWSEKCSEKQRHLYGTVFWQKDRTLPRQTRHTLMRASVTFSLQLSSLSSFCLRVSCICSMLFLWAASINSLKTTNPTDESGRSPRDPPELQFLSHRLFFANIMSSLPLSTGHCCGSNPGSPLTAFLLLQHTHSRVAGQKASLHNFF